MAPLPQDTKRQHTGRLAAAEFKAWCERNHVFFREVASDEDFGVDGELEIGGSQVSGLLVKTQVKGLSSPRFSSDRELRWIVKSSTMRYWAALPLNVIAVLVNTSNRRMYWTQPSPVFDTSPALLFTETRRFDDDPEAFLHLLRQLAKVPAATSVLDQIERFLHVYVHLQFDAIPGDLDVGTEVNRVDVLLLESLYEHVAHLRTLVGLADKPPISFVAWRERNRLLEDTLGASSESGLLDAIGGEILRYLPPLYGEALAAVRDMVKENKAAFVSHPGLASLVAFGRLDDGKLQTLLYSRFPWGSWPVREEPKELPSDEDHRRLTAMLEDLGCCAIKLPAEPR